MMLFWLICAAFVAIALAFVLPPLMAGARKDEVDDSKAANVEIYRDQISELEADLQNGIISQEQFQQDRDDIERRLLADVAASNTAPVITAAESAASRGPVYAIALAVPVIALAFYLRVGTPAAITGRPPNSEQPQFAGARPNAPMSSQDIEGNVASLAKRMEQNPNDAAGWAMLGRSYLSLEKYSEASNAFGKVAALKPNDAEALADYAFAMGMANGRTLLGQPAELIKKALSIDPENPKAMELAGSVAFEAKNYKDAIAYWQRLQQKSPKDSELSQALAERIAEAQTAEKAGK